MNKVLNKVEDNKIRTLVKFTYDGENKRHIAFITKSKKSWIGCREGQKKKKKIVVPNKQLVNLIQDNVLYKAELIPMVSNNGFIAIDLEVAKFPATIETTIRPDRYKVEVKFGNKVIIYDPQKGRQESRKLLPKVMELLKSRIDIEDKESVIEEFYNAANMVLYYYIEYKNSLQ